MAPGDLNLKKSWHPGLMKNQQKVWEKEQEALLERKKIQERQDEIAKERELAELRALQKKKGEKTIKDRVDWMYDTSGVGDGGKLITDESEEYLLGRKRVDELIASGKSNDNRAPEKTRRGFDRIDQGCQLSQRDQMVISREDPMLKIQQQRLKKLEEKKLDMKLKETSDRSHYSSIDRHRSHRSRSGRDRSRERAGHRDGRDRDRDRDGDKDRSRYKDRKHRDTEGRYQESKPPRESQEARERGQRDSRGRERSHEKYKSAMESQDKSYRDRW